MSWNDLSTLIHERLADVLASGDEDGPDAKLKAEYAGLLHKAIADANPLDDVSALCVNALDQIYQAKREHGHFWVDLVMASTVHAFMMIDPDRRRTWDPKGPTEHAVSGLDRVLRIGRYVTPDAHALVIYARAVRATSNASDGDDVGADWCAAFLNHVFLERNELNGAWIDVLWNLTVLGMRPLPDKEWKSGVTKAVSALPQSPPLAHPASPERVEGNFAGLGVTVITKEGVTLSDEQRETLRLVAGHLGGTHAVVLIGDRTCLALEAAEARYGFAYLVETAIDQMATCVYRTPEHTSIHLGDGTYLLDVFGFLFQVVRPNEYPEPPAGVGTGVGIPLHAAHEHRDKALEATKAKDVLAIAMPTWPVPEADAWESQPSVGSVGNIIASDVWHDGCEGWHSDQFHYTLGTYLNALMRHGEGVGRGRYGKDAFIAHKGEGYVCGLASDAHELSRIRRGASVVVTEIDRWEIHRITCDEDRRHLMEKALNELSFVVESGQDGKDLVERLIKLTVGMALDEFDPLLEAGTTCEVDDETSTVPCFRYDWGPSAVRFVLDEAEIDVTETLSNVERICSTPEGAYLNEDAKEMKDVLTALMEKEDAKRENSGRWHERRRRQWQELDKQKACRVTWHRQMAAISLEALRRAGQDEEVAEGDGLWATLESDVVRFSLLQPDTLADALLYLDYLGNVRQEFDYLAHEHGDATECAAIIKRLIWEYTQRDDPTDSRWFLGACDLIKTGMYAGPVNDLTQGDEVLVVDGPLFGTRGVVVRVDGHKRTDVSCPVFGRATTARMESEDLLRVSPQTTAMQERVQSLKLPKIVQADRNDAARLLGGLFAYARFQPDLKSADEVSRYLYGVDQVIRAYRATLARIRRGEVDDFGLATFRSHKETLKHEFAPIYGSDGVSEFASPYDLLGGRIGVEDYLYDGVGELAAGVLAEIDAMIGLTP